MFFCHNGVYSKDRSRGVWRYEDTSPTNSHENAGSEMKKRRRNDSQRAKRHLRWKRDDPTSESHPNLEIEAFVCHGSLANLRQRAA